MTSQVIVKIDKKLKDQAMKKAQNSGLSFSYVIKLAIDAYVKGDLDVELVAKPKLNAKTRRELIKISHDLKQGKNMAGPFKDVEDAIAYLKNR
jgi:antitoxin component of RelBE/YafQ-DinJ toxin-antitoxin module